jgi:KaiC/GvpD/RAD55 family RecA-like ATPase
MYLKDDEARHSMEKKALQFALDMQHDLNSLEAAIIDALSYVIEY